MRSKILCCCYYFSVDFEDKESKEEKERDTSTCKICKKSCQRLLQHLNLSTKCKDKYGDDYDILKKAIDAKKKATKRQWNQENKTEIRSQKQDYYQENKDKIRKQQAKHYKENSKTIQKQKAGYKSQNKEEIYKQQANYKNEHREEIYKQQTGYKRKNREAINENQTKYRKRIKKNMSREDRFAAFKRDIVDGPNFACCSCNRELFKNGVRVLKIKDVHEIIAKHKLKDEFVREIGWLEIQVDEVIVCHCCLTHIKKGKLPSINVNNGLELEVISEEFQLTDLEQQLVARSLIFMKVKKLPKFGMQAVHDKVISVPLEQEDITKTVTMLPRNPEDAKLIAVQLKRKVEMKNSHLAAYIRPERVIKAVQRFKELGNIVDKKLVVNPMHERHT